MFKIVKDTNQSIREKCSDVDLQFLIAKSRHGQGNTKIDLFYDARSQTVREKLSLW